MNLETAAVHAGREDLTAAGVHVPPIDLSTTNPLPSLAEGGEAYDQLASGGTLNPGQSAVYQRLWNPNVDRFERGVAALEHSDGAVAFATGMAAVTAVVLACVSAGKPHIVGVRPLYGGTDHLLDSGLLGSRVTWAEPANVADAIEADTGLVICETPANPSLDLVDIEAVVAACGSTPVMVDNTFATPVLQQPLRHGAALVMHSATKYLGGHGDQMGGVVAASEEWLQRLRPIRAITGGLLSPMGAYQLHRGLQTLPVRIHAQQNNAQRLAEWLEKHPAVASVQYPGLPGQDPQGLLGRQLAGPGAMIAIRLAGGEAAAAHVAENTSLIVHAVSLGGTDTLIQHPAGLTHRPVAGDAKPDAEMLRLSVGLESFDDLAADLGKALEGAPTS